MDSYVVAFWNLENLFAPEGFARREPWIAEAVGRDLQGWTQELFDRKIAQLDAVIRSMGDGAGPDLFGVCEVENRFCLEALGAALNAALPGRSYDLVHAGQHPRPPRHRHRLRVRREPADARPRRGVLAFRVRRTGTRDITQATFRIGAGNDLMAMCNHWPSRAGGPSIERQGFRMTAGETLGYWHERTREIKGVNAAVIVFGDLNDEPSDPSVTIHANASRERDDIENALSARFYNLAWGYMRQQATTRTGTERTLYGTLYWNGNRNLFDQILVSRAMLDGGSAFAVREETARIVAPPAMVDHRKSFGPVGFGLPRGDPVKNLNLDGFSDHFPVTVTIDERTGTA